MQSFLALLLAVVAGGSASLFIRFSQLDPVPLAAFRMTMAAVVLLPLFLRSVRKAGGYRREWFWISMLAGIPLGFHMLLWNYGVRMTSPGNATLLVTLSPLFTPFLFWWLAKEKISKTEGIATALGLLGAAILAWDSAHISRESLIGDILCLLSMIGFCFYLAAGRKAKDIPSIWIYIPPVYGSAGIMAWILAAARGMGSPFTVPLREWMWIVALVIVCTIIGHTLINYCLARMRGQIVSVTMQGQFVVAAVLGWLTEGVIPRPIFYPAALLTMAGIVLILLTSRKNTEADKGQKQADQS